MSPEFVIVTDCASIESSIILSMKLAFVSAHPAPYRDPFLRRLAARKDIDVKIYSLSSADRGHGFWNLEECGYKSELIGEDGDHSIACFFRLLFRIILGGFDVICWPGFSLPCTKAALIVCALMGKRYGFCADSIAQPKRSWLSKIIKRFVIKKVDFIFVPGKAARDFFVNEFQYPIQRICLGQYAMDGLEIEKKLSLLRRERKLGLRRKFGLAPDDTVFIMVANMIQTRHYPITAMAFKRFAEKRPGFRFVMVGSGPELEKIQCMAADTDSLRVIPGLPFDEMLELYSVADVYVHGGCEPASTALVIGAIAKLPLITSRSVGCAADVLVDGETGVLIEDCLSEDDWVHGFERMIYKRSEWQKYGEKARELSRSLDSDVVVDSFVSQIHNCD